MSKEKLYGLRDQLGKFLYDPTPDQAAWRDKLWEEGRFDEILKTTKRVEEQFAYVEKQIEAVEAAEPSIGEKLATNVLLNLPWGKGLRGTGIGSLLGIAEEELGAAETQRLKDIEQELHQLNAIKGRDLEGGKVTSGTISGIDAEIETLEDEAYELKKLLSTRLSDEPEWMPEENQFEPSPREQAKWEAENLRQKQLDERANRFLNAEEAAQEEAYYKRIEGEPEGPPSPPSGPPSPPSGGGGADLPKEAKPHMISSPVSRKFDKAFAQRNPTIVREVRDTSEFFGIKLDEAELQKLSTEDAAIVKEVIKKEKRADKMIPEIQEYLGSTEKREVYRDIDADYKPYLDTVNKILNKSPLHGPGGGGAGSGLPSLKGSKGFAGRQNFDDWLVRNDEELRIAAGESGVTREAGFDFDEYAERMYRQGFDMDKGRYHHYGFWEDIPLDHRTGNSRLTEKFLQQQGFEEMSIIEGGRAAAAKLPYNSYEVLGDGKVIVYQIVDTTMTGKNKVMQKTFDDPTFLDLLSYFGY